MQIEMFCTCIYLQQDKIDATAANLMNFFFTIMQTNGVYVSCDGRVVKALDLKSNGIFPRRFEPYSQRILFILQDYYKNVKPKYHT